MHSRYFKLIVVYMDGKEVVHRVGARCYQSAWRAAITHWLPDLEHVRGLTLHEIEAL